MVEIEADYAGHLERLTGRVDQLAQELEQQQRRGGVTVADVVVSNPRRYDIAEAYRLIEVSWRAGTDHVRLPDDRATLLAKVGTPVLVVDLYMEEKLDARQALQALGRLAALQTVSPGLLAAALAYLGGAWKEQERG